MIAYYEHVKMEDGCFWPITIGVTNYLFPVLVVNYWRGAGKICTHFLLLASDVSLVLCNLLCLDIALVKTLIGWELHIPAEIVEITAGSLNAGNREL